MQALAELALLLPLPVVREHIQEPLLLSLYRRPDVALALISLAGALGSTYTAIQIVPPLLAVLCSPVPESTGALTLAKDVYQAVMVKTGLAISPVAPGQISRPTYTHSYTQLACPQCSECPASQMLSTCWTY